jgi:hypothetical protein
MKGGLRVAFHRLGGEIPPPPCFVQSLQRRGFRSGLQSVCIVKDRNPAWAGLECSSRFDYTGCVKGFGVLDLDVAGFQPLGWVGMPFLGLRRDVARHTSCARSMSVPYKLNREHLLKVSNDLL